MNAQGQIDSRIKDLGNKSKKVVDLVFLLALFLFIACYALKLTIPVIQIYFLINNTELLSTVVLLLIALYRLFLTYIKDKKSVIVPVLLLLFGVVINLLINDYSVLTAATIMIAGMGVSADRILAAGISGNIVMILNNLIVYLNTPHVIDATNYQRRQYVLLGDNTFLVSRMNNYSSTDFAAHYFWIIAPYLWIRGKKITWGEIFALTALTAVVYSLTGSTNLLLCCGLLLAFAVVIKVFHKITEAENNSFVSAVRKTVSVCSKFSYLIFAAVSIILSASYSLSNPLLNRLNTVFHNRFSYGHRGIAEYGIHLFASDVPNYGIDTSADDFYNFIDNSYVNILVGSGIILLLFYICFMTFIQVRHKKYIYGAVILAVCALSCVEEHHFAEIAYNFFPLLLFADINDDEKNSSVTKFLKPKIVVLSSFTAFAFLCVAAVYINLQWFRQIDTLDKLDERSGKIYASVQKNLDNGSIESVTKLSSDQYGDVLLDPEDFELVTGIRWNDASDNLKAHSYYAFYYDNTVDPSSSDMTDILISDETKQLIGTGSVVVEYDAVTGKVYSVWYSETKNCSVINDGRLNRAVRLRMDEQPEGYYTGEVYE